MHWLSEHQIGSVPRWVPKLQGSNLVFFWPGWWKFSWHGRAIPFQTPPPISSQLAVTASSSLWEGQLKAFDMLCWHCLFFWLPFWYHFLASILGALCSGWVSIKLEVSHEMFPSYRGPIWCSSGLAGGSFHGMEGFRPPPPGYLLNLLWLPHQVYGKVSWEYWDFMLALSFFWPPFWYHFPVPIFGALCIGWVSIKFEVFQGGFPSYRGLIWCSSGLAGGSQTPPPWSSQLAVTASSGLWEGQLRVFGILC